MTVCEQWIEGTNGREVLVKKKTNLKGFKKNDCSKKYEGGKKNRFSCVFVTDESFKQTGVCVCVQVSFVCGLPRKPSKSKQLDFCC